MSHSNPVAIMQDSARTDVPPSAASAAPWGRQEILPVVPAEPQWRVVRGSELVVVDLDQLHAALRKAPEKVGLKAELKADLKKPPQDDSVAFVVPPDSDRMLPAADCPELHADILARDEKILRDARASQGKLFFSMLAAMVLLFSLNMGGLLFLVLIWGLDAGYDYFAARHQLAQLQRAPADYLAARGADLRYALWLRLNGQKGLMRSLMLAVAWVVIALLQLFAGGADLDGRGRLDIQAAGLVKLLVASEPWRLLTGAMLHGGILHLLMNLASVVSLGFVLERSVHRSLVVPVWLVGALGGSLFSWWLLDANSIGASGGVMGMFGFLLAMGWQRRKVLPPDFFKNLLRSLGLMLVMGVVAWAVIDNAAHVGGLLAGALFGWLVFRQPEVNLPLKNSNWLKLGGWLADGIFIAVAVLTGYLLLK